MPKITYTQVNLAKIFDFKVTSNGSVLTKTFVQEHKGSIPVYGSTMDEYDVSYGYIMDKIDGIKYFDDCLTINRNGSAGYLFIRKGHFCINSDVTPLVLFDEYKDLIDLEYIKYVLEPITRKKFNHNRKAGKAGLSSIEIAIPVNFDGEFDKTMQKLLADRYSKLYEQRKRLLSKVDKLKEINVILPQNNECKWAEVRVTDLFTPVGGEMLYSKAWAKKNQGDIPLYSGTTTGEYAWVNVADYNGEYLTWCIDGLAGYIMYHKGAFSITCHRGILIRNDNCMNVDLKYIKYILEPIFRKRKKGRVGDLGKNEYTSLKPIAIKRMKDTIPIPLSKDGTYDLEKQKILASRYEQIEEIKRGLYQKITELTEIIIL